jgi:predicted helicase
MHPHITAYLQSLFALYSQGITTEHSFRGALETLLKNMTGFAVVNEAQHIACGAPDLTLLKNNIPVGYVEAKDIGKNLNSKDYKNQFDRYNKALDNLIITDYLTFQLFEGENFVTEVSIGKVQPNKITPILENFDKLIELVKIFSRYNGKSITNSKQLAEFMAAKTQLLANVIGKALNDESTLYAQLQDFQEILLPTLDNAQFADMYAQTIAYGIFVARLQDDKGINLFANFTRQQAANLIPKSNPFLRKLFQYIAGYDIDENIRWIVDSLADMFNYVDIDAIHREFISKDKDPFLHFYENFLTRYDKKLKNARGAYYTPLVVVKFIVNAVDDILKTDFNLAKGLADNSMVNINDKEYHKVQILDPATGTGTFLAEVVRNIYQKFVNNAGAWDDYVHQHLIPRLNGFEIMMSPYTMAHLKIETILQEFGHNADNNQRLRIYLTNSLEEPKQNVQKLGLYKWLSDEAFEAQKIKNEMPIMIVLGNPPYSGKSQNKSKWILHLMKDYKKEPTGGRLQEKNSKWINDDYAKFIRFGQYFVEKNGEGVLAYINNHSFLDNPTFRGMRYNLLQTFDKIYIIDLHGNAKKKETAPDGSKDENVFDIQQGVSINIFVKTHNKKTCPFATIFYSNLYGKRQGKYNFLMENNLQSIQWTEFTPQAPQYFFVNKDFENREEYEKGFLITDLFLVSSMGITTANDNILVGFKPFKENNQKYNYRPFDIRFINYDMGKIARNRYNVMQHFIKDDNLGLCLIKISRDYNFSIFITNYITDKTLLSSKDNSSIFPLYLYQEHFGQTEKMTNLNEKIKSQISTTATPEQIFDYIYAILHSPSYREKYKEFLKIDFPRIPYPKSTEQFEKLAAFGEKLRHLHLMENITVPNNFANFPKSGNNKIENSFTEKSNNYQDNKVWINDSQYFDNVSEIAWEFYIGGYQPTQKWLKDRKGRALTYEDIEHYQKIIFILNETDRLMREIDLTL